MEELLSPKSLARAMGVSESSVKRWVDGGLVAARVTAGGHRRIARSDALRFVRGRGTPLARPELLSLPPAPARGVPAADLADTLSNAMLSDDGAQVRGLIVGAYVDGTSIARIADVMIRPALGRIGELWLHDDRGVLTEHRAVDATLAALGAIRELIPAPGPKARVALGGGPEGDPYLVAPMIVSLVLADLGFCSVNLGPHTPARTVEVGIERYRPAIVWQSVSSEQALDAPALRSVATAAIASGAACVVGGRVTTASSFRPPAGAVALGSAIELEAFARGFSGRV